MTTSEVETVRLTIPCFVWSIHRDRVKWRLTDQDILDAINTFREKTGQVAKTILLHPSTQKYGLTPTDGVVVHYSFSVLAHEVFFPVAEQPPDRPDPPPTVEDPMLHKVTSDNLPPCDIPELCNTPEVSEIPPLYPVSKKGRPLKRGEVHRTTEWRRRRKAKQVVLV